MARRIKDVTPDSDWLYAAWQLAGELKGDLGLAVQIGLSPSPRKGVWRVTARLVHVVDGVAVGVHHKLLGEYPNGDNISLGAYVLRMMNELDSRLAEEIMLAEAKDV